MVRIIGGLTASRSVDRQDHLIVEANPDDRSILYMHD
jgi:hypothetical protein